MELWLQLLSLMASLLCHTMSSWCQSDGISLDSRHVLCTVRGIGYPGSRIVGGSEVRENEYLGWHSFGTSRESSFMAVPSSQINTRSRLLAVLAKRCAVNHAVSQLEKRCFCRQNIRVISRENKIKSPTATINPIANTDVATKDPVTAVKTVKPRRLSSTMGSSASLNEMDLVEAKIRTSNNAAGRQPKHFISTPNIEVRTLTVEIRAPHDTTVQKELKTLTGPTVTVVHAGQPDTVFIAESNTITLYDTTIKIQSNNVTGNSSSFDLITGNSSSFDQNMADEKNELNIDLGNDLVTYINSEAVSEDHIKSFAFKNDPAIIPNSVSVTLQSYFVELGPCQPTSHNLPNKEFPKTYYSNDKFRSFHESYYFNSQNALLDIFKEQIHAKILDEIKHSQMFSVIIDTTTDISNLEQFTLNACYVYKGFIQERLVALVTASDRTEFEKTVNEAKYFTKENQLTEVYFKDSRQCVKKKLPGKETADEVISSPFIKYRYETYFKVLDKVNTSIQSRFSGARDILKDLTLLSPERYKERKSGDDIPLMLHQESPSEPNSESEYLTSDDETEQNKSVKEEIGIDKIFYILSTYDLQATFLNLHIAFKALGTLPVSSLSAERSFSKMKIIKSRLRSTMCQDRLESLMFLSCERDVSINNEDAINAFGHLSEVLKKALIFK
ncbi:hypothetical protein QTP88_027795 [Uroleucon formosanum]